MSSHEQNNIMGRVTRGGDIPMQCLTEIADGLRHLFCFC